MGPHSLVVPFIAIQAGGGHCALLTIQFGSVAKRKTPPPGESGASGRDVPQ